MTAHPRCSPRHRRPTGVCLWSLLALTVAPARAADALFELTPYRVRALVAVAPDAMLDGASPAELLPALDARAASIVGGYWTFGASEAPTPLAETMLAAFDQITPEEVLQALGEEGCDKAFLVRIASADEEFSVVVREFDVRTQLFGTPVAQMVLHQTRLTDAVFRMILQAFAPLAVVEDLADDKGRVTLRLRAAALPPRDASLVFATPGTIFRPVIRANERTGKPRRIQAPDWTFLTAESVEGPLVKARMVTGVGNPLSSRRRGRTEQLALAVRPPEGSTMLELRAPGNEGRPLAGYQVYSHPADSKETMLLGATDYAGEARIDPGDGGVRVLLIKSGSAVVARLPILPGLVPTMTARVSDDDRRLQAEGFITGFQEQFVDLIARRQVLMARVRARIKAGKKEEAKELFDQLRRLATQQDLSRTLLVERQRLISSDPRARQRIDKLFDDTQAVINRFLDSSQLDQLERELRSDETAQATGPERE
ncbi:MAG: hypothetical protein HYX69_00570 [Planctomycetia bacterium]|nr:hypothetical protein [Planctomycetia bacterium]